MTDEKPPLPVETLPAETIERVGFLLTAEHRSVGGAAEIILYASGGSGPLRVISPFEPYYYVGKSRSDSRASPSFPKGATPGGDFTSLSGESVVQITFPSVNDAISGRSKIEAQGLPTFEADIRPTERFLMDRGVNGSLKVTGPARLSGSLMVFRDPLIAADATYPNLRICSLDIETAVSNNTLISIACHLTGGEFEVRQVFLRESHSIPSVVAAADFSLSICEDERSLLRSFVAWIQATDPDIIVGWNVIGFDLAFLLSCAERLNEQLRIGRDNRTMSISERSGRFSRATIPGRVVLDGPTVLRNSFYTFDSFSLENVSQVVLGRGKLIAKTDDKAGEIERLFRNDPFALASYNMEDAILVSEIFFKLGLLELTIRRSQLSGMLLDQVGMSTATFDHLILPRLHRAGYVAPNKGEVPVSPPSSGGHVLSPIAGVYDEVLSLDFRSLYPSIIRSFGIDPLSRARADVSPLTTPSRHHFSRVHHILPEYMGALLEERARAKASSNNALSQAIKIMMNSFYGVMGSPSSRLYHPDLPDAITGTGKYLLIESKAWLETQGHRVLYGDTDSLFVQTTVENGSPTIDGQQLAADLTAYWHTRLAQEYGVESHLVIEFKRRYRKFLIPVSRSIGASEQDGTKKRYAGLVASAQDPSADSEIEFVGLEVVRSDATLLAQDFQRELYRKIFLGAEIPIWISDHVQRLRKGEFDSKLVYRKRLHKPPKDYGNSPPPYVRAALLLDPTDRSRRRTVKYVITMTGPVPIEQNPKDPDYNHYLLKQLKPVADAVLPLIGVRFDELLPGSQIELFR